MKKLNIKTFILTLDTPTKNGRIYPKGVIEKGIQRYQKLIDEKRALGEIYHLTEGKLREESVINLDNVSHLIESMSIERDRLMVELSILDTSAGWKLINDLANPLVSVSWHPSGFGKLSKDYVVEEYEFISIDAFIEPKPPLCPQTILEPTSSI